jgi:hypothetical protein
MAMPTATIPVGCPRDAGSRATDRTLRHRSRQWEKNSHALVSPDARLAPRSFRPGVRRRRLHDIPMIIPEQSFHMRAGTVGFMRRELPQGQ